MMGRILDDFTLANDEGAPTYRFDDGVLYKRIMIDIVYSLIRCQVENWYEYKLIRYKRIS